MHNDSIEKQRQTLQKKLDNGKTQLERNILGQFSTPFPLAYDILSFSKNYRDKDNKIKLLDPALGTGVFYSALLASHSGDSIQEAKGFEVDKHYGDPSFKLWENEKLEYLISDFTKATVSEKKYNLIVCNPPYVRHHHINDHKKDLQSKAYEAAGIKLSGLSGLYCYFMALAHPWMEENGLAIWLIPSEFMDVNYGKEIKEYLTRKVKLLKIHRFDPSDVQFDDATVTSAIVVFKNELPNENHRVEFSYGGTLGDPKVIKNVNLVDLVKEKKWTRFPLSEVRIENELPKLGDFFSVKRGIATGDNKFFIISIDEINRLNLPISQFRPILPSPRYLETTQIEADENGFPLIKEKLFVLDCKLSSDEVKSNYPTLYSYLNKGIAEGVPDRYLCKKRKSWFAQENRKESCFYCTYIGRSNKEGSSPFRFISNKSKAIVSNSYLVLYPKPELEKIIRANPNSYDSILHALNSITSKSMTDEGRVYGGGMQKLEPKELLNVPATELESIILESQNKV